MKTATLRVVTLAVIVAAGLGFASLWAQQAGTGQIHGTVRDQTGGAIAGATLTITNVAGGVTRNLTADGNGMYSASDLRPGTYTARATFPGFQPWQRTNILLEAGGDQAIDAVLLPGTSSGITIVTVPPGAPLRILCSTAVHTPVEDMVRQLERAAGRAITIDWDSSQRLSAKIDAGEAFDIAILSLPNIDTFVQKGAITTASRVYLGRTGAGIGVRKGSPRPDVSTREKLKQVLLNAKSIAMNPTGASSIHFNRVVAEMGITEQLKPKMMLNAEPGRPQKDVEEGKAELVWTQITEIKPYPGLEVAGPLPPDVQSYTEMYMGVAAKSSDAAAASAVIKFLTSDAAKPTFRAAMVEVR